MELTQGNIFNKKKLNELINQVKSTYISQGYYNVKISENIEIDGQNKVGIELDISEGEVARIKTMRITMSIFFLSSDSSLLTLVTSKLR
jgi:outer membrane protein insertion porin family